MRHDNIFRAFLTLFFMFSVLMSTEIHAGINGLTMLSSFDGSENGVKLFEPSSIWYDRSGNVLLVANTNAHKVQIVTLNGEFKRELGRKSVLKFPYGLAVDSKRTLYVSELNSGIVKVFSRYSENFEEDYVLLDYSKIKTSSPIMAGRVYVDANDNLYIEERNRKEILVFSPDMKFKFMFGGKGAGPGKFFGIDDICVDVGRRIYIADSFAREIKVFSPDGKYLLSIGGNLQQSGLTYQPLSINIDSSNRLWTIDSRGKRILAFDVNGDLLPGTTSNSFMAMSLFMPVDIAIDYLNRLYILDRGAGKINVFNVNTGF